MNQRSESHNYGPHNETTAQLPFVSIPSNLASFNGSRMKFQKGALCDTNGDSGMSRSTTQEGAAILERTLIRCIIKG
jgi:hypothetical protein